MWEIDANYPEARLSLGSANDAGWPIEAPGVHALHCELFWDGQTLWVADSHRAGGVFLDGSRVHDWVQVQGPSELRFGQASLDIETSAPIGMQMVSSPSEARPVTVTDMVAPPEDARPSRPLFGGAAGDESVPDLDAEKTRVAVGKAPIAPDHTQIAAPGTSPAPAMGSDLRPRLGGGPAAAAHAPEATRMVANPVSAPAAGLGAAPPTAPSPAYPPQPPGYGAPPNAGYGQPLQGSPAPVVAPPPAPPQSMPPSAPPPPMPPMAQAPMAQPGMAQGGIAPPQAPHPMTPPGASPGGFVAPPAAPPAEPKKSLLERLFKKKDPAAAPTEGDPKQAMPLRTWILLSVTVLVTVGWLLWDDTPEPVAQPQGAQQTATPEAGGEESGNETEAGAEAGTEAGTDPEAGTEGETSAEAGSTGAGSDTEPAVAQGDPSSGTPAASEVSDVDEDGTTIARRAADAYIGGRHGEALDLYRRLLAAHPQDETYRAMVRILVRNLQTRCVDGVGPGGEPCASP